MTGIILLKLKINKILYSWYIHGFADIAASSVVIIVGTATLPSATGATGSFELYTYNNQDNDVLANG